MLGQLMGLSSRERASDYVPIPYASRERYMADTGRLGQLIGVQSRALADAAGTQAEIAQRKWASLAQAFGRFVDERQAKQLATEALAQEQAKLHAAEQLRRDEMAALEADRQADREARTRVEARLSAQDARQAGDDLAGQLPPGAITEPQLDVLSGSPAQAARTRYHFGPGTAEGPELMPTAEQAELATVREAVTKAGGIVGPNGQIVMPPKPAVAKSLQRETALVNGRRQFVNFNPDDGTYADLQGNPVTPTPDPTKEPRDPVEVVVQGPNGPLIVNRQTGTSRPVTASDGTPVGPTPGAMERMDSRKFSKAAPVLKGIGELSERINTNQGVYAKMAGGAAKLAAKVNLDDDVAEYDALVSGFTPMIARALGHTGVLTQQDVDSVKALFPRPGDSKTLRDRKIARMMGIISDLEGVEGGNATAKPTGRGANPFAEKP